MGCAISVVCVAAERRPANEALRFVRSWYPLPLYIFFFEELRGLVHAIFPGWLTGGWSRSITDSRRCIRRCGSGSCEPGAQRRDAVLLHDVLFVSGDRAGLALFFARACRLLDDDDGDGDGALHGVRDRTTISDREPVLCAGDGEHEAAGGRARSRRRSNWWNISGACTAPRFHRRTWRDRWWRFGRRRDTGADCFGCACRFLWGCASRPSTGDTTTSPTCSRGS